MRLYSIYIRTFRFLKILIIINAKHPPISAVISCGIPIVITSLLTIFVGMFSSNKGISFEAEIDKNIYFTNDPIIIPKYCPYLPRLFKIIKLSTNNMLEMIIKGMKGPKGLASWPVRYASKGVKEPTSTP